MNQSLNIIAEITKESYENSIILTFNCSLVFYENLILKIFRQKECYNNSIIMDKNQYEDLINREKGRVDYCGTDYYALDTIEVKKAFHPKIILLTDKTKGKLLIGSGNNTLSGYGRNYELFYKFEYKEKDVRYLGIFQDVISYLEILKKRYRLNPATNNRINKLIELTPWLKNKRTGEKELFIHNLDRPILGQILNKINGVPMEIILTAPYFDPELTAVKYIIEKFPRAKIQILSQSGNTNFPIDYYLKHKSSFPKVVLNKFNQPTSNGRNLHGKFLYFRTNRQELLYSGSPNISKAALMSTVSDGNAETGILIQGKGLPTIWKCFVDPKAVSKRDEIEVQPIQNESTKPIKHQINITTAHIQDDILTIEYESDQIRQVEVVLNDEVLLRTKLERKGNIKPSITKYLQEERNSRCIVLQLRSPTSSSNLTWVNSVRIKRMDAFGQLTRNVISLSGFIKDMSRIKAIIELTSNLRLRENKGSEIIKGMALLDQEEAGEERELPPELYYIEEKSQYDDLVTYPGQLAGYKADHQFLNDLLGKIHHSVERIPHQTTSVPDSSENQHKTEHPSSAIDDVFEAKEKLQNTMEKTVVETIDSLGNKNFALQINDVSTINQRLATLTWFLNGVDVAKNDIRLSARINPMEYIEASNIALGRLWLDTNEEDNWDLAKISKEESNNLIAHSVCLISFNLWVLKNKIDFKPAVEEYQTHLIGIYFALAKHLKKNAAALDKERIEKIVRQLINVDKFGIDVDLRKLINTKISKSDVLKATNIFNTQQEKGLHSKKKRILKELYEELEKTKEKIESIEELLQTERNKYVLDHLNAKSDKVRCEEKIEKAEKIIRSEMAYTIDKTSKIKLPQVFIDYFQLA